MVPHILLQADLLSTVVVDLHHEASASHFLLFPLSIPFLPLSLLLFLLQSDKLLFTFSFLGHLDLQCLCILYSLFLGLFLLIFLLLSQGSLLGEHFLDEIFVLSFFKHYFLLTLRSLNFRILVSLLPLLPM